MQVLPLLIVLVIKDATLTFIYVRPRGCLDEIKLSVLWFITTQNFG